jgi:hypothetical protein
VSRIADRVDTQATAKLGRAGTGAGAAHALLPTRANHATSAAVVGIGVQRDARAAAVVLHRGAALIGTSARDANLARAAAVATTTAIEEVGLDVDALGPAQLFTRVAGAAAVGTDQAGVAHRPSCWSCCAAVPGPGYHAPPRTENQRVLEMRSML